MAIKIIFDNAPEGAPVEYEFTDDILSPEMKKMFSRLVELNREAITTAAARLAGTCHAPENGKDNGS